MEPRVKLTPYGPDWKVHLMHDDGCTRQLLGRITKAAVSAPQATNIYRCYSLNGKQLGVAYTLQAAARIFDRSHVNGTA